MRKKTKNQIRTMIAIGVALLLLVAIRTCKKKEMKEPPPEQATPGQQSAVKPKIYTVEVYLVNVNKRTLKGNTRISFIKAGQASPTATAQKNPAQLQLEEGTYNIVASYGSGTKRLMIKKRGISVPKDTGKPITVMVAFSTVTVAVSLAKEVEIDKNIPLRVAIFDAKDTEQEDLLAEETKSTSQFFLNTGAYNIKASYGPESNRIVETLTNVKAPAKGSVHKDIYLDGGTIKLKVHLNAGKPRLDGLFHVHLLGNDGKTSVGEVISEKYNGMSLLAKEGSRSLKVRFAASGNNAVEKVVKGIEVKKGKTVSTDILLDAGRIIVKATLRDKDFENLIRVKSMKAGAKEGSEAEGERTVVLYNPFGTYDLHISCKKKGSTETAKLIIPAVEISEIEPDAKITVRLADGILTQR